MKLDIITLTKIDAAKRQLETALSLYFQDGDIVSIHALTGGAGEIIRVLNRARGGDRMANDFVELLKGKSREQFKEHINKVENFLKHASSDSEETLELNPMWTEVRLYDASRAYVNLVGESQPSLMGAFVLWFGIVHRDAFEENPDLKKLLDQGIDPKMKEHCDSLARRPGGRREFLSNYMGVAFAAL